MIGSGSRPVSTGRIGSIRAHLEADRILVNHLISLGYEMSGAAFRQANHLARGALIVAAAEQSQAITAEHVLLAATETF
jgi:hypothetical protein